MADLPHLPLLAMLEISRCDLLRTFTRLSGPGSLRSLQIVENHSLENLTGLGFVQEIEVDIVVKGNPALTSLAGMDQLQRVGEILEFSRNAALSLSAILDFVSGVEVGGATRIEGNWD